jgi:hypothetical protein
MTPAPLIASRKLCETACPWAGGGAGNVGERRLQVEGLFYAFWLRFRKRPIWSRLKAYIHPEDVPPHPY